MERALPKPIILLESYETSHPPTSYLPRKAFKEQILVPVIEKTFCEWKGETEYFIIKSTDRRISMMAAWSYNEPSDDFLKIKSYVVLYPNSVYSCFLDCEEVKSQEGDLYGSWLNSDLIGPFKGGVGSLSW